MKSAYNSDKHNHSKKIIHIDMDSFYASVEIAEKPHLRNKPVAVAGSSETRGVVTTCNYEARKFGVRSAMPSITAKKLCPNIIFIPVHMDKYRDISSEIHKIFKCYTKIIEPVSLDEAYLDVTLSKYCGGDPTLMASQIRSKIFNDLKITASAGIAPNKFLSKIASEWNKPNGQYCITISMIDEFMFSLPVRKIIGVGEKTEKKLNSISVRTCGDLQNISLIDLKSNFGKFGSTLYNLCRGIDERDVVSDRDSKSLSVEDTYAIDLKSREKCIIELMKIFKKLQQRLDEKKYIDKKIKSCFIKVKYNDFKTSSHQTICVLPKIENYLKLLDKAIKKKSKPIRLLGVGVIFDNRPQLNLNIY